jgi:hypothetical protein
VINRIKMKYFAYCCFLFLFTASCNSGTRANNKLFNPPSNELVWFCSEFISKNWNTDHHRLVKKQLYGELVYTSMQRFDDQPFYPVLLESSQIIRFLKNESGSEKLSLFEKTTGVWGFFYFRQNGELFPDGVIEEWAFSSNEKAEDAMNAMKGLGDQIFFNTQPYFCRIKNKLYVFHTRAMAFSYDQKLLFEAFVQRTGAKTSSNGNP